MAVLEEGKKPYIVVSTNFWRSLDNDKQRAFLLSHETDHVYLNHMQRAHGRKKVDDKFSPSKFNKAADYYINLVRSGFYFDEDSGRNGFDKRMSKYLERPECGLYDTQYANMSVDDIYHLLPDGDGKEPLEDLMDSIVIGDEETIARDLDKTLAGAYHNAVQSNSIGDSEGQMVKDIERYFEPVIDYRQLLDVSLSSASKELKTYKHPSLLSEHDIIYPANMGEYLHILFGSDSSGSMTMEDYRDVSSAIGDIMTQFDGWSLKLVTCDTGLHEIGDYDSNSEDSFEDVSLEFKGGGGTDMRPIAEMGMKMYEDGDDIDVCIIVTDGYIPESVDNYFEPSIVNVVIVTKGGNKNLKLNNAEVIFIQ
jgi:predicted metal-dependent peptidase